MKFEIFFKKLPVVGTDWINFKLQTQDSIYLDYKKTIIIDLGLFNRTLMFRLHVGKKNSLKAWTEAILEAYPGKGVYWYDNTPKDNTPTWPKCIDDYESVHEFAMNILPGYYNIFVGYGEGERTDVKEWYQFQQMEPNDCLCKKCKKERIDAV